MARIQSRLRVYSHQAKVEAKAKKDQKTTRKDQGINIKHERKMLLLLGVNGSLSKQGLLQKIILFCFEFNKIKLMKYLKSTIFVSSKNYSNDVCLKNTSK